MDPRKSSSRFSRSQPLEQYSERRWLPLVSLPPLALILGQDGAQRPDLEVDHFSRLKDQAFAVLETAY
jgi:hypothetical protein